MSTIVRCNEIFEGHKLKNLTLESEETDVEKYLNPRAIREPSIENMCIALKYKCSMQKLRWYLERCKNSDPNFIDSMSKCGCPCIFYAIKENFVEGTRLLLEYRINFDVYTYCSKTPQLAFAILLGKRNRMNTTRIVKELLTQGANSYAIPKSMRARHWKDPIAKEPKLISTEAPWCTGNHRAELVKALTIINRHSLYQVSKWRTRYERELQIAGANNMTNFLRIPYFVIGLLHAVKLVMDRAFSHIANNNLLPLVKVFAGPSGHGKTELAEQMGVLLSAEHEKISCDRRSHGLTWWIEFLGTTLDVVTSTPGPAPSQI